MIKQKHQQLFDILREELRGGKWPKKEKLPNLKELAAMYDVSINVASKAVELLKNAGLVSAKVGDGIYSETSGAPDLISFRYSGDRMFGKYRGAKVLRLLLEDNTEEQMKFWNSVFEKFTLENPDIELEVNYNLPGKNHEDGFDMAFGGVQFLARSGFTPDQLYDFSVLEEFYPEIYRGLLLNPGDLAFRGSSDYFPYGAVAKYLVSAKKIPTPLENEDVMDYIERVAVPAKTGYSIQQGLAFLAGCGLEFFNPETGGFQMPPHEKVLSVFSRAKKLYENGSLVWLHGHFSDYEKIWEAPAGGKIGMAEVMLNGLDRIPDLASCTVLPYPCGKFSRMNVTAACVKRSCRFPEECARVLRAVLSREAQKQMLKNRIACPLLPGFSDSDAVLEKYRLGFEDVPDLVLNDAFFDVIAWEFFYFLNGRRGSEVCRMIESKMKYFMNGAGR